MGPILVLYPKPFDLGKTPNSQAFQIDPKLSTEDVERILEKAAWDEQIVLGVVLPDLPHPVPFGFRKADWCGWMVHQYVDRESDVFAGLENRDN